MPRAQRPHPPPTQRPTLLRAQTLLPALALAWAVAALVASAAPAPAAGPLRPQARARVKVGLALGGGSARGMAHVGVLEWLEEHHVPVDFIAGTSMGGLVAGAYATGLSGEEIRAVFGAVDWELMFLGDAPYRLKSFRRKQDARLFPSKLAFGLRKDGGLPSGLDSGHQAELLLARLTLPYSGLRSFDDLPTPFRCTATDLKTATLVVFHDGDLAQAMRATMSLPGLFPPVRREGQVLVDGGVLDNVPADVARSMGADVVVAVDVGPEPGSAPPSESRTIFGLLSQTIDIFMYIATRPVLSSADLVLRPAIQDFGAMDWRKSGQLADLGYQAAEANADQLLPLALDDAAWARYQEERRARVRRALPVPGSLAVHGVEARELEWVEKQLRRHVGVPLERVRLEQDLTELTGTARYNVAGYRLRSDPDRLDVSVQRNPGGPPSLSMALELDNTTQTALRFSLRGRLTAYDVLGFGSELRLDARLGSPLGLGAELYRPIGGFGLFVAPHASINRTQRLVYGATADSLLGESNVLRAGAGLDLGTSFGSKAELRLGYDLSAIGTSVFVGAASLPARDGAESVVRASFEYDGQDAPVVPRSGLRLRAELRHILEGPGPESSDEAAVFSAHPTLGELRLSAFAPLGNHRLFLNLGGGTAFDTRPISLYRWTLGGPLRLSALRIDELSGRHYLLGSAGYLRSLGRLPDLVGGPIYLGGWLDVGSAFEKLEEAKTRVHLAACFLVDTRLGPFYLGGSVGTDKKARVFGGIGVLLR